MSFKEQAAFADKSNESLYLTPDKKDVLSNGVTHTSFDQSRVASPWPPRRQSTLDGPLTIDFDNLVKAMNSDKSSQGLDITSRTLNMVKYDSTFAGKLACRWLVTKKYARDVATATLIGNILIRRGYVRHVPPTAGKKSFESSSVAWYQFIEQKIGSIDELNTEIGKGEHDDDHGLRADLKNADQKNEADIGHGDRASMEDVKKSISASTSERMYGENASDLLSVESDKTVDSQEKEEELTDEKSAVRPPLFARLVNRCAYSMVNILGWPFALHVVSTVTLGVCVVSFTEHPTHSILVLSPLVFAWLYIVERQVRKRYVSKLQNNVWRALSVSHDKTVESEYAAWFNRVLGSLWIGWLVPYVERIVKKLVNPILNSIKPSFFSTLSIDEFNLGCRGPYIKSVRCYDGNTEDMILEWDLDLCTKDMRIVLAATLGGKFVGMPIKVYVTDLHIIGPLRLGFKWMPVAPHLKWMTISFLRVPEAKVKVKPVSNAGIDVTELPGLQGWVDKLVKEGLQHAMVEPNSIFWDVEDMWKAIDEETDLVYDIFEKWKALYGDPTLLKKASPTVQSKSEETKKQGPIAYVDIIVYDASALEVQSFDLRIAAYCCVLHGKSGKFKTSIVDDVNPEWQEPCMFEIHDWSTESQLLFEVYDHEQRKESILQRAKILKSDTFIGKAVVDLRKLAKKDGCIHDLELKLENASTGFIHCKICVTIADGCFAPVLPDELPRTSNDSPGNTLSSDKSEADAIEERIDRSASDAPLPAKANNLNSLNSLANDSYVVSGFLFKRYHKESGYKNWKRRFATVEKAGSILNASPSITSYILRYYTSRLSEVQKGELILTPGQMTCLQLEPEEMEKKTGIKMPTHCKNGHLLVLTGINKTSPMGALFLCFENTAERERWLSAFDKILPGSGNRSASLSFLSPAKHDEFDDDGNMIQRESENVFWEDNIVRDRSHWYQNSKDMAQNGKVDGFTEEGKSNDVDEYGDPVETRVMKSPSVLERAAIFNANNKTEEKSVKHNGKK